MKSKSYSTHKCKVYVTLLISTEVKITHTYNPMWLNFSDLTGNVFKIFFGNAVLLPKNKFYINLNYSL